MHTTSVHVNAIPLPERFAFENLSEDDPGKNMEWSGPVAAMVDQAAAVSAGQESLTDGYWSSARTVRAAIDSRVGGPDRIMLISLATDVALRTYAGVGASEHITALRDSLSLAGLLGANVSQTADLTSSAANAAALSKAASAKISDRLPGAPLLMVALCHGGLVAALQTALYTARRHDVVVYPVRSSLRKHGDYDVHLPDADEIRHITKLAEDRTVVVHDEDASGGTTIQKAITGLRRLLWRTRPEILGVVNLDSRSPKEITKQGEWWEKI